MNLSDTHCHLYLDAFQQDLQEVLDRAVLAGVGRIWLPAIDWNSISQMERLTHPAIRFYKMAGIHPCEVAGNWPLDENRLHDLLSQPDFVAVGETGLDYYWNRDQIALQKKSLTIHCRIAKALEKPIVLHNRESTTDLLDLIESEQDGSLRGVWHCFTGTLEEGRRALDLGLYLGVGGVLTFKNAGVDKVIAGLEPDRLLLETDSPYLAPAPNRGKRNEPAYIRHTADRLASLLGMQVEELANRTSANAIELFRPVE